MMLPDYADFCLLLPTAHHITSEAVFAVDQNFQNSHFNESLCLIKVTPLRLHSSDGASLTLGHFRSQSDLNLAEQQVAHLDQFRYCLIFSSNVESKRAPFGVPAGSMH